MNSGTVREACVISDQANVPQLHGDVIAECAMVRRELIDSSVANIRMQTFVMVDCFSAGVQSMEGDRFDGLARRVATRRSLIAGIASGLLASAGVRRASAAPAMELSPTEGKVGATVRLRLSGLVASEEVELTWFDPDGRRLLATFITDGTGALDTTFKVPSAVRGDHRIRAMSESGTTLNKTFKVTPSYSIPTGSRHKLDPLAITVKGYLANTAVRARWYQTTSSSSSAVIVASGTTTRFGSVTLNFPVPGNTSEGVHRLEVRGLNGVVLASRNLTACDAGREADGAGGCCGSYQSTATGRAECCSKSWNPTTGKCVMISDEDNCYSDDRNCANSYCIGRICGSKAGFAHKCYGDPGCSSGTCRTDTNTCACMPNGKFGAVPGDPAWFVATYPCCSGHRRKDGPFPDSYGTCCVGDNGACSDDPDCCRGYCYYGSCRCLNAGEENRGPSYLCCSGQDRDGYCL